MCQRRKVEGRQIEPMPGRTPVYSASWKYGWIVPRFFVYKPIVNAEKKLDLRFLKFPGYPVPGHRDGCARVRPAVDMYPGHTLAFRFLPVCACVACTDASDGFASVLRVSEIPPKKLPACARVPRYVVA